MRSREDYAHLLQSSWNFYAVARDALGDVRWDGRWRALDVRLDIHDRVPLLEEDLRKLGCEWKHGSLPRLSIDTFAQALGLLYVVEGSSLGSRVIGRAIMKAIGPVPISFHWGGGVPIRRPGEPSSTFSNPSDPVALLGRNLTVLIGAAAVEVLLDIVDPESVVSNPVRVVIARCSGSKGRGDDQDRTGVISLED